jgi:hypothetical protein
VSNLKKSLDKRHNTISFIDKIWAFQSFSFLGDDGIWQGCELFWTSFSQLKGLENSTELYSMGFACILHQQYVQCHNDFLPLFLFRVKLYKQERQGGFDKTSSKALNVNLLFSFIR